MDCYASSWNGVVMWNECVRFDSVFRSSIPGFHSFIFGGVDLLEVISFPLKFVFLSQCYFFFFFGWGPFDCDIVTFLRLLPLPEPMNSFHMYYSFSSSVSSSFSSSFTDS